MLIYYHPVANSQQLSQPVTSILPASVVARVVDSTREANDAIYDHFGSYDKMTEDINIPHTEMEASLLELDAFVTKVGRLSLQQDVTAYLCKRALALSEFLSSFVSFPTDQTDNLLSVFRTCGAAYHKSILQAHSFRAEMQQLRSGVKAKLEKLVEDNEKEIKANKGRYVAENRVLKMEAQKLRSQVINLEKELRKAKKTYK
ncbi:hypothetical protein L202_05153 [Cryptococcus amylolentus CBS 6039]|uniref:Uncharacterized protein n=1 Tax=Cryptococcus amylolentus CBS 6039 TaxID=1295533 RepID=A0A1E3HJF4_9TREE|nr:hypothetical protein L202_05153 [Cryptococcus amylolentus CBS 6039]ODN76487.1 hypothetical protein L202_05153 [Cryptococcus amylolentus CBS 6039]